MLLVSNQRSGRERGEEKGTGEGRTDAELGRTDPEMGTPVPVPETGTFGGTTVTACDVAPASELELSIGVGLTVAALDSDDERVSVSVSVSVSAGGVLACSVVLGPGADVVGSTACEDSEDAGRGAEVVSGGRAEGEGTVTVTRTVVVAVTVVSAPASGASVVGCARATPSCAINVSVTLEDRCASNGRNGSSPRGRRCALRSRGLWRV